mgnify:CR=1 FL=1
MSRRSLVFLLVLGVASGSVSHTTGVDHLAPVTSPTPIISLDGDDRLPIPMI